MDWHHRVSILEWPSPIQSRLCGWSYLIKFLIRNLSYSLCSEPSRTVHLPAVMYTMYARQNNSPPLAAPYYYSSLIGTAFHSNFPRPDNNKKQKQFQVLSRWCSFYRVPICLYRKKIKILK